VGFCSCGSGGKKDIVLGLKFKKYHHVTINYRRYVVARGFAPVQDELTGFTLMVDSILPDSSYLFSGKLNYIRVKDKSQFGAMDYYSGVDDKDMDGQERGMDFSMKPLLDANYKFMLDKHGKVLKPLTFADGRQVPDEFPLELGLYQIAFPAEKVALGQEWTSEFAKHGEDGRWVFNYHVQAVDSLSILIMVDGTVRLPRGGPSDFTGRYHLNRKTSALDSCEIDLDGGRNEQGKLTAVISIDAH
jgi:hypothetical protein